MQTSVVAHHEAARKAALREAILRHIAGHSLAADTADGILACWLPEKVVNDSAHHMEGVLKELVAEHWLIPAPLPGGDTLYIANLATCSTLR